MNKLIANIPLFSSTLEYFDRQTGGAWRLRSCLTNMGVWAANAHLWALTTDDTQRICTTMQTLATVRTWLHEVVADGFALDLTSTNIRKTLGLNKQLDPHEEAKRLTRIKCIKARSATKFTQWYKETLQQLEEQRKRREESVEQIAELLASTGFEITEEIADYFHSFHSIDVHEYYILDTELYDEAAAERQLDQLSECLATVLVTAHEVCDAEYNGAITEAKVAKLSGFSKALKMGMEIVGVDSKKLASKQAALDKLISAQEASIDASIKSLDDQIAEAMEQVSPAPATPRVTLVKSDTRLAREAAALAAQTAAEEARLATVAQAEKDLVARLEAERAKAAQDEINASKARAAAVRRQRKSQGQTVRDLAEIKSLVVS